jgi:photosystem II stability/assembly factor-like uncharacterized protein
MARHVSIILWALGICFAQQPSMVVVGTARGLFVSSDGGLTWHDAGLGAYDIVAVGLSNSRSLVAASAGMLFTSDDYGSTWESTGLPFEAQPRVIVVDEQSVSPRRPRPHERGARAAADRVYIAGNGFWASGDRGRTWTANTTLPPVLDLVSDSRGALYAATTLAIYKSVDRGESWQAVGPSAQRLAKHDFAPEHLYAGGRNGLFLSLDEGVSWRQIEQDPNFEWSGSGLILSGGFAGPQDVAFFFDDVRALTVLADEGVSRPFAPDGDVIAAGSGCVQVYFFSPPHRSCGNAVLRNSTIFSALQYEVVKVDSRNQVVYAGGAFGLERAGAPIRQFTNIRVNSIAILPGME